MSSAPKNNGTYQLITPPNALKARVGAGIGIDTELAKRANSAVENMQGDFLQRVSTAVGEIAAQLTLAEQPGYGSDDYAAEITRISHDLQTQGAAFDYPLVSDICASLSGYVKNLGPAERVADKVVGAHIDALRSVIGDSIDGDGDGGQVGQDLIKSLSELVALSTQ